MTRTLLHALAAAMLVSAPAAAQSPDAAARARRDSLDARMQRNQLMWAKGDAMRLVDSIAEAEFRKDSLGSITIAVVNGRDLAWAKSYGFADRRRTVRATSATVYRIASITKQVTAIALMQLVDAKTVRLSDPVDLYFAEISSVRGLIRPPTLQQLATMTSGLARDPTDRNKRVTGALDGWTETLIAALPATDAVAEPGTTYRYSNVGYAILGAAVGRAAGAPYVDYVRGKILRPLGMTSTDFVLSPDMRSRLAVGVDYDVLYKDTLNYEDAAADHSRFGVGVPAGGLYSTVGDVAKLVSLQLGFGPDSVLRLAAVAQRNGIPVASFPTLDFGYGLGTQVARWGDTTAIGHSGNLSGYTSQLYYDIPRRFGVIVLRSVGGGHADAHRLAGLAFRKLRSLDRP